MNLVDIVILLLASFAAYRGWRRGLVGQIFELGGGFLGLILGVSLGPRIASSFTDRPGLPAALISLGVVFVGLSLGQAVGFILGQRFASLARGARLGGVDSALGAGFGAIVTLVSFWLIGSLLVHGPSASLARALRHSSLLRLENSILPEPPNVLAYLQQYLDTSGFPQVFAGLPPIGPPVRLPAGAQAQKAIAAADQSTVRVVVPACGGTQLGSGWIASSNEVVTNAHVVAGGDGGVKVQEQGSASPLDGDVVLFDPKTDIAVLHVDGLTARPLRLDTHPLDRGAPGATLGYPGLAGGRLVPHRAAIQSRYSSAQGRDIYGRSLVTRDIYALRSIIRQGDSGGPFVQPDGSVAGVVFAASTTDRDTGYALTAAQVANDVRRGNGKTSAVSTGACTH